MRSCSIEDFPFGFSDTVIGRFDESNPNTTAFPDLSVMLARCHAEETSLTEGEETDVNVRTVLLVSVIVHDPPDSFKVSMSPSSS